MLRIAFDIGGVISRYPAEMKEMMCALAKGGVEVHVVTDMSRADALACCRENGIADILGEAYVHSADWSARGDLCKAEVCKRLGIDVLIDDRPDYCADAGVPIGLVLSPRPSVPYYAPGWVNESTPAVCVPPKEYEAFREWKKANP